MTESILSEEVLSICFSSLEEKQESQALNQNKDTQTYSYLKKMINN